MATKTIEKNKIKQKGVNSFINELKAEVKKVEWPEKKSVVSSSIIIMVIMMFFVLFVAAVDMGLAQVLVKLRGI